MRVVTWLLIGLLTIVWVPTTFAGPAGLVMPAGPLPVVNCVQPLVPLPVSEVWGEWVPAEKPPEYPPPPPNGTNPPPNGTDPPKDPNEPPPWDPTPDFIIHWVDDFNKAAGVPVESYNIYRYVWVEAQGAWVTVDDKVYGTVPYPAKEFVEENPDPWDLVVYAIGSVNACGQSAVQFLSTYPYSPCYDPGFQAYPMKVPLATTIVWADTSCLFPVPVVGYTPSCSLFAVQWNWQWNTLPPQPTIGYTCIL